MTLPIALRRLAAILVRSAAIWPLALQTGAALAQGAVAYTDPYVAERRGIEVTADSTALLDVADSFDSAYRRGEATVLREFVERRQWLQALGEPQPAAANVGEVLDARWPESIGELRTRGAVRAFDVSLVRTEVASTPSPSGSPAPRGLELTLDADFAVTNRGALPVAALQFGVSGAEAPGLLDTCDEHELDAIVPGETRVVHCAWQSTEAHLAALRTLLAEHGPANATVAIRDVTFGAVATRAPRIDLSDPPLEIDPRRGALARGGPACEARNSCRADPAMVALALLPWLVVPLLLGIAVGRESARP